jgi:transcriptional antiterminator NusG
MEDTDWLVIQVNQKAECRVYDALVNKGYESFLPTYLTKSTSKLSQVQRTPLFPGYVFCRPHVPSNGLIVTTPGVLRIVAFGGHPAVLGDDEVTSIRRIVNSNETYGPHPYMYAGQQVIIITGPLAGLKGIVSRVKQTYNVVVSVDLLMRSVSVETNFDALAPIDHNTYRQPQLVA